MEEDRNFYNYIWFIKDTKEVFYIGKGKGRRYKSLRSRNKFFLDMYRTHDCCSVIVKDNLTEKEAFENEKKLIKWYRENTNYRITNQTDGGDGISGYSMSDYAKRKISKASKEMWQNEEFRSRMIEIRNNPNGAYKSDDFRQKISKIVSGSNNPNFGNHWDDEKREKLSKLRKQNKKSCGSNNPMAKRIICIETGEIFKTIIEAKAKYKVNSDTSFTVALNNKTRTAANLHWSLNVDELSDDGKRYKYYLNILSESRFSSYICVETKEIFKTQKELNSRILGKGNELFNSLKDKNGTIKLNNKTYMLISYYIHSPYYQE